VEGAGAGACGDQDLATTAASEAGVVGTALQGEFLDGIDAGNIEQRGVRAAVVDIRAIDRPVVGGGACAIDGDGRDAVDSAKARLIAKQVDNAGLQRN
jgi:hypothetical protein